MQTVLGAAPPKAGHANVEALSAAHVAGTNLRCSFGRFVTVSFFFFGDCEEGEDLSFHTPTFAWRMPTD
jgi:hypothetical protein